jgi:putative zinc finger protein
MTESMCRYTGDRDGALIAFLYDAGESETPERARFEAHLQTCERCRDELALLRGVRMQLAQWAPPEPGFAIANPRPIARLQSAGSLRTVADPQGAAAETAFRNPQSWRWRDVPAWAQVAAALLFLGVSAGIANLDVRYDANGLSVRTGWSKAASLVPSGPSAPVSSSARATDPGAATAPWRADLAALERQLKDEIRIAQTSARATPVPAQLVRPAPAADASAGEVVRRVRALIEESEKHQNSELALRIAEVMRDVHAERQADLVRIDRTLGAVQNNLGVEVMKTRQQVNQMNILYRASQR